VHTQFTIRVISTFFDPIVGQLQVSGIVLHDQSQDTGSLGQHHTLKLEVERPFSIGKIHGWDSVAVQALKEALRDDKDGATAAVVMQEGLANICLITQFRTVLKQRVESVVPKKRSTSTEQDAGIRRFYDKTLTTLMRNVDFGTPRPLLLASPGFVAAGFKQYITDQARDKSDKLLAAIAREATVVHTNSGHVYALNEILKSKEVLAKIGDMKFTRETRIVDQFFEKLKADDSRAWYGKSAVEKAIKEGAVGQGGGVLLINNSLFRSQDIETRRYYVALVDKVKADGGDVRILSSDHESGQRLDMLGSIAAILTYPIYDLDDEDEGGGDGGDGEGSTEVIPAGESVI
jgi:protein pelota